MDMNRPKVVANDEGPRRVTAGSFGRDRSGSNGICLAGGYTPA